MAVTLAALIEALQQLPLLDRAQKGELAVLPQRFPDVQTLTGELLRRGWLTPYQVNRLVEGKGAGLVLGQYILLDLLGQGGMGAVYRAWQGRVKRHVALKVIRPEALQEPGAVERFQREAESAAKLADPHVVRLYDADEVNGVHFLVMEYIEGTDLARLLQARSRLPVAVACEYVRQAALGLQHAFEKGLVHRDIKPANLMLAKEGVIKVMDLGLARTARSAEENAAEQRLTAPGVLMGTADYLAPEQAQDARRADIRADIYALGCTLYHLLAGEPPFPEGTLANKIAAHMLTEPSPIEDARPEVGPALGQVVRRMMAKAPQQRFQTPGAAARALEPFTGSEKAPAATLSLSLASTGTVPEALEKTLDDDPTSSRREPSDPGVRPQRSPALSRLVRTGVFLAVAVLLAISLWVIFSGPRETSSAAAITTASGRQTQTAAVPELPAALSLDLGGGVSLDLVLVKKGEFLMGSPAADTEAFEEEKPQHPVEISRDFYLGKFAVTRGQFARFVKEAAYKTEAEQDGFGSDGYNEKTNEMEERKPVYTWANPGFPQTDAHPVVNVTWNDAQVFCTWLRKTTGQYVGLPTEAEWEFACRAGTTTRYFTGDDPGSLQGFANVQDLTLKAKRIRKTENWSYFNFHDGHVFTAPVGSFQANGWKLYDVTGNVRQWCADGMRKYTSARVSDPRGPTEKNARILRGGSWNAAPGACRCADRIQYQYAGRSADAGFRIAVHPDGP